MFFFGLANAGVGAQVATEVRVRARANFELRSRLEALAH